jgi:hypothetical protein
MARTRYPIFESEYPYFLTCTIVALEIFQCAELRRDVGVGGGRDRLAVTRA